MSGYLNYYKYGGLSINPPDLVQISNESFIGRVGDGLKRLLKYITDFFKKVFSWIKDKINNVLKSRIFKNKIEKIKKKKKLTKLLANNDSIFKESTIKLRYRPDHKSSYTYVDHEVLS